MGVMEGRLDSYLTIRNDPQSKVLETIKRSYAAEFNPVILVY
jgi:hypothetical protein